MVQPPKFKSGSLVKLKSGGPSMTVGAQEIAGRFHGQTAYRCIWFDGRQRHEESFPEDAIEVDTGEALGAT